MQPIHSGWNNQLQELHDAVSQARIALVQDAQMQTWRTTTKQEQSSPDISFTKPELHGMNKLHPLVWKRTLQNCGDSPGCLTKITKRSGRQSLSHRTSTWHKWEPHTVSHVPRGEHSETPQRKNKACQKRNKKHLSENIPADGCMNDAIQKDILEAKIRTLNTKKAIWSFTWGLPALWETILPIYKKRKYKKHPSSYRPISLLSYLGKLLERIINTRLMAHLEANNILSPTQSGYRKHRRPTSTTRTINRECLLEKDCGSVIRLSKAFDKAWREGLLLKVLKTGM